MRILNVVVRFVSASWLYLGLSIILLEAGFAFLMMFVLPPMTIAMVFIGLFTLLGVMVGSKLMSMIEHAIARAILSRGSCARCHGEVISHLPGLAEPPLAEPPLTDPPLAEPRWECAHCRSLFDQHGQVIDQRSLPTGIATVP